MSSNRILQNAKWIVICKVVQSLIQMLIGVFSARYLGPANYGLISYAGSVVAFAVPIMQLGMAGTLVQEYISNPAKEGEVLGTSLVMNIVSGIACVIGVTGFAALADPGEQTTIAVCALYSISLVFQATEMIRFWFQAKLLSKHSSLAALGAYCVVASYKVYLLISGKSVYWFAISYTIEYGVVSIILMAMYKHLGGQKLRFSAETAKNMFSKSRYYILASMMVTIFQNTDHVMLKIMVGDAENGFYTTAVTCTMIVGFVYTAIIDSARPVILESKKRSQTEYESTVSSLYCVIIYLTLVQSIVFSLLAVPIVAILYGSAYMAAVPVLRIMVWQLAFSYIGSVRNIWILGEGRYSILWKINLAGALANVILNAVMIPWWGASGAALASVGTQFFTNVIMGFILKPIRENNRLLLKGCDPRLLGELLLLLKQK